MRDQVEAAAFGQRFSEGDGVRDWTDAKRRMVQGVNAAAVRVEQCAYALRMVRPQLAEGARGIGERTVDEDENRIGAGGRKTVEPGLGSFQLRQRVGVELVDAALDVIIEVR